MGKILISTQIVGNAATEILHREVNNLSINKKLDGDKIWNGIVKASDIIGIQSILDENFGKNEIKIV